MRSGMKRDQRRNQLPKSGRSNKLRPIERMKPRPAHRRRVADIVQPRRRHQTIGSLCVEMPTKLLRCRHHTPHMRQPPRLPHQPGLGLPPRTLRQNPAHTTSLRVSSPPRRPTADAQRSRDRTGPAGIWRLPAGFAPLPLLPSAGAAVRAGRYASPSVRRPTSCLRPVSAHTSKASAPRVSRQPRPVLAPRRAELPWQQARKRSYTASDLRCENFLY